MTADDGHWHLGIGDPTPIGWITVAAYGIAAWLSWRRWRPALAPQQGRTRFWPGIALVLLALGINKQLDLQTALTDIGRVVLADLGWQAYKRTVQVLFIAAVVVGGALGFAALSRIARPLSPGRSVALAGVVFVVSFVCVRAASFHHVDLLLGSSVGGLRWNWILELGGIALIAVGAALDARTERIIRTAPSATRRA